MAAEDAKFIISQSHASMSSATNSLMPPTQSIPYSLMRSEPGFRPFAATLGIPSTQNVGVLVDLSLSRDKIMCVWAKAFVYDCADQFLNELTEEGDDRGDRHDLHSAAMEATWSKLTFENTYAELITIL